MDNEVTRDDVLGSVDNSQNTDTISGSEEETGRDPSQDISNLEIPDNFRKEYQLPDGYKTISDVLKGFKGQNELRGQHSNEVGDLRQKYAELAAQNQQMMQRLGAVQSGLGAKTPEQQQQEFLELLTSNPRQGIQSAAMEALKAEIQPLIGTIQEMRDWQQRMTISNDKNDFVRQNNLTPKDEEELASIIAADPDFYRSLPSTAHVLKAARAELISRRDVNKSEEKPAEPVAKNKQAQVLSTTNSRPAANTGAKTIEELKEEILSKIPRV